MVSLGPENVIQAFQYNSHIRVLILPKGCTTHLIKLRTIVIKSSQQKGDTERSHASAYPITDVYHLKVKWKHLH